MDTNLATCDLCGEEIIQTARGWHHRKRYHTHRARPRLAEPVGFKGMSRQDEADDLSDSIIGTAMALNQVAELASSFTSDPEPEPQRDYSPTITPEPVVDLPSIELEAPEPSCSGMDSASDSGCDCSSSSDT